MSRFTGRKKTVSNVRNEAGQGKFRTPPVKHSLIYQIRTNRKAFVVYMVLSVIVLAVLVRSAWNGLWESAFVCFLTMNLFLIPPFIERSFKIELPTTLEVLAFIFVFCAMILGEIGCYYMKVPLWDSALHTVCGFMFAAFGFCLLDILNKNKYNKFDMSPFFMAFIAFCFAMTVGVMWEFIEFLIDTVMSKDMQKDFIIKNLYTVTLDKTNSNTVIAIENIESTVINYGDGNQWVIEGGYIDVGLRDTMKDLLVNFIGALVFSTIGFFYVKHRGKGIIASQFIPRSLSEPVFAGEYEKTACELDKNENNSVQNACELPQEQTKEPVEEEMQENGEESDGDRQLVSAVSSKSRRKSTKGQE